MAVSVTSALVRTRRVILVCDLAGFHRAFDEREDLEMADFLQAYYALVGGRVEAAGGRVVKLIGDAVLSVFPAGAGGETLRVAVELERRVAALAAERGVAVSLGSQLHGGTILEGELGYGEHRRLDVIGRVVNQTFLLGRGRGICVSEELERELSDEDRSLLRGRVGDGASG